MSCENYIELIKVGVDYLKEHKNRVVMAVDKNNLELGDVRDVDVFVRDKDLNLISEGLVSRYRENGVNLVKTIYNEYSRQLFFIRTVAGEETSVGCQWDIMPGASWRGITYLSYEDLQEFQISQSKLQWISAEGKIIYKDLSHWLWNGVSLGKSGQNFLMARNPSSQRRSDKAMMRFMFFKKFSSQPISCLARVLKYFVLLVSRFVFRPPGEVFFCGGESRRTISRESGFGGFLVEGNLFNGVHYLEEDSVELKQPPLLLRFWIQKKLYQNYALVFTVGGRRVIKKNTSLVGKLINYKHLKPLYHD